MKLQNSAFRSILTCDKRQPIQEMHEFLKMPYLNIRRFKHMAIEMYKVYYGLSPQIICNRFVCVEDVSNVNTMASVRGNLYIPRTHLQSTKHSFSCGAMVWNALPDNMRQSESIEVFKGWLEILY